MGSVRSRALVSWGKRSQKQLRTSSRTHTNCPNISGLAFVNLMDLARRGATPGSATAVIDDNGGQNQSQNGFPGMCGEREGCNRNGRFRPCPMTPTPTSPGLAGGLGGPKQPADKPSGGLLEQGQLSLSGVHLCSMRHQLMAS